MLSLIILQTVTVFMCFWAAASLILTVSLKLAECAVNTFCAYVRPLQRSFLSLLF